MFHLAKTLALRSNHRQHHHAVVITKGGAIVAMGWNKGQRHAEYHAFSQLWPSLVKHCVMWSFRWCKSGKWGMAKPCRRCMEVAALFKKCFYTNEKGQLVRL